MSSWHRDIYGWHRDMSSSHKYKSSSHRDMSSWHRDIYSWHRDMSSWHRYISSRHRDMLSWHIDISSWHSPDRRQWGDEWESSSLGSCNCSLFSLSRHRGEQLPEVSRLRLLATVYFGHYKTRPEANPSQAVSQSNKKPSLSCSPLRNVCGESWTFRYPLDTLVL